MSWSRSGFSKHYKKIKVEGYDIERFLNLCVIRNIEVRNVHLHSDVEAYMQVSSKDLEVLCKTAGRRYNITVIGEGGYGPGVRRLLNNKVLVVGIAVFVAFFLYQSMFIAEIEVNGYESISEQTLRKTMREAGFYEGCRKNVNLNKVKLYVYENHDNISWIGIKYKGNLAQVSIAEADVNYPGKIVKDTSPCNIVADKNGYIDNVDPQEGVRAVDDGDYVREGDVLISGIIPLEKTTYDEESQKEKEMYVHAAGIVKARIPVRLNFYGLSYETVKTETGRKRAAVSVNDKIISCMMCPYEYSSVDSITLLNAARPFRIKVQIKMVKEVKVKTVEITEKQAKKAVIGEIKKYAKEKLPDNAQILNKSLNFTQEKNIINIGVTLETLQKIGIEEEIIVDKSNRKSEEDDDQ